MHSVPMLDWPPVLDADALSLLCCPACRADGLARETIRAGPEESIDEGVVWCRACRTWYPVEGGVLDLLVGELAYGEDRRRFQQRHRSLLDGLDLRDGEPVARGAAALQVQQQQHFDWYATNESQSYLDYSRLPFWQAVDAATFDEWQPSLRAGGRLLDVGCGNGRATEHVMGSDLRILGFDVSKGAVRQAHRRFGGTDLRARAAFFTADASRFPVKDGSMDHVLAYGVLHHLPSPRSTCHEIARVLNNEGIYLGSENNHTRLRAAFDLLQRLSPLWREEAGPEALISRSMLREAFEGTGVAVSTRSFVFVPPHLVNVLPPSVGEGLLRWTDRAGGALPVLKDHGGLIVIEGVKSGAATARGSQAPEAGSPPPGSG